MPDHVYRIIEVAGSSDKSIEDAIQSAVGRAAQTLRGISWFEVLQTRGQVEAGKLQYQVVLKVGFTLEAPVLIGFMGARPSRVTAGLLAVVAIATVSPLVRAQIGPPPAIETPAPAVSETMSPAAQISVPAPPTETPPAEMLAPQFAPILLAEQLDQLLAPIALYPDALLAQILMASTYPLEIVKANRWFRDPRHAALSGDRSLRLSRLRSGIPASRLWQTSRKSCG